MKVVYVYIGDSKLPAYVLDNLSNTKSKFPEIDLVFISDNTKSLKKVSDLGINVWQCKNQVSTNSETMNSMDHPMDFRSGFWFSTLARFFAIEEFMESNSETEILHIEADVWLSKNFPFEKFISFSKKLAYPIESVDRGAASVLYVGSLDAIKRFNNYCKNELKNFPNSTDMTLLGEYSRDNPDRVIVLPIAPDESSFKDFTPDDLALKASSSYKHFQGVFDPLTYGMHLFGIDAKNNRGILKLYSDTPIHILDIRKLEFESFEGEVTGKSDLHRFNIYNLHIHSKNLRIFRNSSSQKEMNKLISMRRNYEISRLSWGVLIYAILAKVNRWFRRTE
jgi:hypothetical protein